MTKVPVLEEEFPDHGAGSPSFEWVLRTARGSGRAKSPGFSLVVGLLVSGPRFGFSPSWGFGMVGKEIRTVDVVRLEPGAVLKREGGGLNRVHCSREGDEVRRFGYQYASGLLRLFRFPLGQRRGACGSCRALGAKRGRCRVLMVLIPWGVCVLAAASFGAESGGCPEVFLASQVLDEEAEVIRRETSERARAVAICSETCKDRAEALLGWVWSGNDEDTKIALESHTAEWRNRNVSQLLASKQSACREFNIFYVAALRSVGIPARHCGVGRWLHRDSYHFFAEYWDRDQGEWVTVDTSDDKLTSAESPAERAANGRWNSLVYYAYPGTPDESDLYGKGRWDKMVRITGDLTEEFAVEVVWPDPERVGKLSAQIWNGGSWRTILIQHVGPGEGSVVVEFGRTHVTTRPVLFSADIEGERFLAMVKAAPPDQPVVLEKIGSVGVVAWSPGRDEVSGKGGR